MFMFENLQVYQKAVNLADKILQTTEPFPGRYYFLSDHLNRASLSIANNIAEGNGRFTKADRKHFFTISRGSTHECIPSLELAYRRKLINSITHNQFRQELETISKMLNGLIKGIDNRNSK